MKMKENRNKNCKMFLH